MIAVPDLKKIKVDIDKIENDLTREKNISVSILRLDKIHPVISGNKYFKLYYFLEKAKSAHKKIITFGGAYSNHLAAAASACKALEIDCIGIVRGGESKNLSHTLLLCKENDMQLEFISKEDYTKKDSELFKKQLIEKYGEHILIPEGGFSKAGVKGAALIANFYRKKDYTHVCCAAGTATTLAGLIKSSLSSQTIIGFSALKKIDDFEQRIQFLLNNSLYKNYCLNTDYHFGGYAKKTDELIIFMNKFYHEFAIPLDFVYTAKMMFGIFELIKKNYFSAGSKILCIHTGGLQGNLSSPTKTFNF